MYGSGQDETVQITGRLQRTGCVRRARFAARSTPLRLFSLARIFARRSLSMPVQVRCGMQPLVLWQTQGEGSTID